MAFVSPANPHCACYVLDRELAEEYVASASFDREASKARTHWNVPERAHMGLCFEHVPPGFLSRYVIPYNTRTKMPDFASWVYHLPNNWTHTPGEIWGKTRVDEAFSLVT